MKDQSPPTRNGLDAAGLSASTRDHGVDVSDPPFMLPAGCKLYTPETYEEWFAASRFERRCMTWPRQLLDELSRHPEPVRAPSVETKPEDVK